MVLENLVIPFQINNKIKGTIVRLSSVASKIINHESNGKDFNLSKNTIQYVDKSLRKFLKKAENKIWFDNTLFIITADHGLNVFKKHINDPRNGRIPFLIYNLSLIHI